MTWELAIVIGLFLLGLVLIVKGGDYFVDGAAWMAEISGIPKFIIGATVVSLATTLPELLTSLFATVDGNLAIASGNAIGSVTANIGIIMAISIICMPSGVDKKHFVVPSLLMVLSTLILLISSRGGSIRLLPSVVLMIIFALFMGYNVYQARSQQGEAAVEIKGERQKPHAKEILVNVTKLVAGAAGIIIGANLLQSKGAELATRLGVPENIIAITLIAIGTSLPELVTTITAIRKKEASLSIGNIIGANVFDLTLILSLCSFAAGGTLKVEQATYMIDIPFCLAEGLIAVVPPLVKKKFYRWQGFALLAVYIGYIVYSCVSGNIA